MHRVKNAHPLAGCQAVHCESLRLTRVRGVPLASEALSGGDLLRRSAREYWLSRQYLYVLVFIVPSREMPAAFSLRASLLYRNINLIVSMD